MSKLPGGVYGYTYSPGLPAAPLFAIRRYRSYETHKLPSGEVYVIGFAKSDGARDLSTASEEMTLQIHPQPENDYTTLVTIPYPRIRQHRQYAWRRHCEGDQGWQRWSVRGGGARIERGRQRSRAG